MPRCGACACYVRASDAAAHMQSKRHQKHESILRERVSRAQRSVYVKYVTPAMTEEVLKEAFEKHVGASVERVDLDPRKHNFALVQFHDAETAQLALSKPRRFKIGKEQIHFLPRQLPEGTADLLAMDANGGQLLPDPPPAAKPGEDAVAMDTAADPPPPPTQKAAVPPKCNTVTTLDDKVLKKKHEKAIVWDDVAGLEPGYRTVPDAAAEAEGRSWLAKVDAYRGSATVLAEREHALRGAAEALVGWLQRLFPGVEVEVVPVGSAANGLTRASGDLDLAVFVANVNGQDAADRLVPFLRDHAAVKHVVPLVSSRLAMVTYVDIAHGDLHVDAAFDNYNAVRNTGLVQEYLRVCPGLSTLVMALSAWLSSDVQRWSTYTCVMLTVMYLQVCGDGEEWVKGEVPNLQAQVDKCADCKRTGVDHQHASKRMKADTDSPAAAAAEEPSQWDYSYCTHLAPVGAHRLVDSAAMAQWLGQHFVGLLVYYSLDFSADKHAVSIRTGGPLPLKHAHRGMWTKSGVVVEDPFELSHNIASKVSENAWHHFKIGGRAYLAQTRHRAGYRRVTKIFAASVEALHADGLAAAQALSGEWVRLEPVKSPAEGVTLDRWLFSGDTAAWYHRRQRRRAQERSEGTEMHKEEATAAAPNHGPLAVHLLYAAAARRLVAELIDGDPAAFSAWLLNIVPRISHLEMKDGSAMAEAS